MQTIHSLEMLRACVKSIRAEGGTIALVPTMGALHAGHMALIEAAKHHATHVIASIFVNPTQFGPNEDFDAYPRRTEADSVKLNSAGVTALWLPEVAEMYPDGFATTITVAGLGNDLCGAHRPGHFDGVATVVAKLLMQVAPDIALFGEKDWQQLAIIRRMTTDLNLPVSIIGVAIQREDDGLALSSRNAYLSPEQRQAAIALPRALGAAVKVITVGGDVGDALQKARLDLEKAGFDPVDYVALVDAATLEPMDIFDRDARILAAAKLGKTRLIDNLAVIKS
ncbi:MAG: pantoate--beta-alanine ligase [Chakrabartia sp.]